jgi:1-acyl-sn-glycerol-3-phosphate acyltransferase
MAWIRSLVVMLSVLVSTLVYWFPIWLLGILGFPDASSRVIVFWSRLVFAGAGVRVVCEDPERLRDPGPCVVVSNHRSHLDGPALLQVLPFRFVFVIKRALARIPLWGWAVSAAGYVAIDRHDHRDSLAGLRRAAAQVRAGRRVLVFPEGTRSPDGRFLPFKKGGIILALEAGVPILPVAVLGSRDLLPSHSLRARPGTIRVRVGEPIPTAGLSYEDRDALVARVEAEVHRLAGEPLPEPAPAVQAPAG